MLHRACVCVWVEFTDHCLNEAFNASCPDGRVVFITEARFGRMRPGRCIGGAFNVGCYKDIKPHLDALCTTRSRCDVSVRDLVHLPRDLVACEISSTYILASETSSRTWRRATSVSKVGAVHCALTPTIALTTSSYNHVEKS